MAWSDIKQYVGSKNVKWSVTKWIELIQEKVLLMGAWDWLKLCKKVKDIEAQYAKSDHVVDLVTETFIISVDDSDDDDATSTDDRSSPEPGPSTSKRPCRDTIEGVIPLSDSD
ncbi:unnamed protein product [Arctia plantaginis]|uniref:Uncharacterized protein n=1 Tax=Arctia plantaginis TaxID=874455 RepID=A0A8S0YPB8_ARCPL|nr:unnamed protein product [Arctia plantaginis]